MSPSLDILEMDEVTIKVENLSHSFNNGVVFKNVSFSVDKNSPLAITGPNGSGKSTLLKIITGLIRPLNGNVTFTLKGKTLNESDKKNMIGLFAPYVNLYDELSGLENISYFHKLRTKERSDLQALMRKVGLENSAEKPFKSYSSGMKQRLRLAFALSVNPLFLIMDEPTTNLDEEGYEVVSSVIGEQLSKGILIIASNLKSDLRHCVQTINIGDFK
ncbi:MAG: ABC transporter ATP-binding protein [Ignavibacteriaceae bacterium]|nr:ABC transporter ATP-binding protein [Ignavibacteria bacterium]MCC6886774.1 ABC transporter ATP-binding protein [Ignavibacteriales bacterium]MDL1887646.1 ABC transporter ATP-binding protein [Ignavibacteria bacterium CHB1]MEB2329867.1 ABC transporter ATP-binding protein [Ignavibacteriaceae bacterium]